MVLWIIFMRCALCLYILNDSWAPSDSFLPKTTCPQRGSLARWKPGAGKSALPHLVRAVHGRQLWLGFESRCVCLDSALRAVAQKGEGQLLCFLFIEEGLLGLWLPGQQRLLWRKSLRGRKLVLFSLLLPIHKHTWEIHHSLAVFCRDAFPIPAEKSEMYEPDSTGKEGRCRGFFFLNHISKTCADNAICIHYRTTRKKITPDSDI